MDVQFLSIVGMFVALFGTTIASLLALRTHINKIADRLDDKIERFAAQLDEKIERRGDQTDEKIERLSERLSGQIGQLDQRVSRLEGRMDEISGLLREVVIARP